MDRWEGFRSLYVLLHQGTWPKYADWSVRRQIGFGRTRTPTSGRVLGLTGPDSENAY